MEAELKAGARWPKVVGYPLFFLICFVFFFHLTLPYSLLQGRLTDAARQAGYNLSVTSLGPALGFGMTAKGVTLSSVTAAPTASGAPPTSTVIDQLSVYPTFIPPGIRVAAKAFGGEIQAHVAGWTAATKTEPGGFTKLDGFSIKNLDLAKAGLKSSMDLDVSGQLNAEGEINHFGELSKATGYFKISGKDLQINGGTVQMYPLPKVALGALDFQLKMDAGKATIDKLTLSGGDVDANGEGEITLNNRLGASQSKLHLDFKPADAWINNKNNEIFKTGLSFAGKPDSRGYYTVTTTGMLGNPSPRLKQ